jgi:Transposase IS116/IS110/IS902 family
VARKGRGGSTPLSRIYVGVQFSDLRAQAGPETLKNQRLKSRSVETAPPAVQACRGARARDRCLVRAKAPELLAVPGCGALTAARLLAETAGVERFSSDAKLARLAGVAPIPALIAHPQPLPPRPRRQPPPQLRPSPDRRHQGRVHEPAREFLARKQAEGKSRIEALRCLKRHVARAVRQALRASLDRESLNSLSPMIDSPNLRPAAGLALT